MANVGSWLAANLAFFLISFWPHFALAQTGQESHESQESQGRGERLFHAADAIIPRGASDVKSCGSALPLLKEALELLGPGHHFYDYASFQYGRCLLVVKEYAQAARVFQSLLDLPSFGGGFRDQIRLELAWLYANGLGVAEDKVRALGLYMLCGDDARDIRGAARNRNAAELIIALNPWPTTLAYELLEAPHTPIKDKWRSWQLKRERNEGSFSGGRDFPQRALSNARSYQYPDDAENLVAKQGFSLIAAEDALREGRLAESLDYLRAAQPASAIALLREIEERAPHRLITVDGKIWRAVDE